MMAGRGFSTSLGFLYVGVTAVQRIPSRPAFQQRCNVPGHFSIVLTLTPTSRTKQMKNLEHKIVKKILKLWKKRQQNALSAILRIHF